MTKEEFKQIRTDLGLSQRKFAELLGQNYRSIQRYESGEWPVTKKVKEMSVAWHKNIPDTVNI